MLDQRLRTFDKIIENYHFKEPLSRFLATYYRANNQMGSRDRRLASRIVYTYFRLGKALLSVPIKERLACAFFLCEKLEDDFNFELISKSSLLNVSEIGLSLDNKLKIIAQQYPSFSLYDVFPCHEYLSAHIDKEAFIKSHFTQPKVWIRIRSGFYDKVVKELNSKEIIFNSNEENPNSIAFENATHLDALTAFEKGWFEIQDFSSQRVASYFKPKLNERWWDCCAGSGGKSLLLADLEPAVKITLTENRPTIIKNLENRLTKASVKPENIVCGDICDDNTLKSFDLNFFEGIIADVPCTGSGTWSRTPEMISGFEVPSISSFSSLQKKIVQQLPQYLKVGGTLIYITCSVFKNENEDILAFLQKEKGLLIESSGVIAGYHSQADTMFVARLVKTK